MEQLKIMRLKDEAINSRQEILDKITAENRGYTEAEKVKVDKLKNEIDGFEADLRKHEADLVAQGFSSPEEIKAAISGIPAELGSFHPVADSSISRGFQPRGYVTEHKNFAEFVHDARFKPESLRTMSVGVGTSGGFTVPDQFVAQIFAVTPQSSIVRPRAQMVPGLEGSPDAKTEIPALDHSAGIHGGIEVSWIAEGGEKPATEPELDLITLEPQEVAAHLIVTDKLLRNSQANLSVFLEKTFREAIFCAEDVACLTGNGVGMPLGVLNSPARINVARAGAGAVAYADIANMISSFTPDSWTKGVWVCSLSVLPQLMVMVDAGNHRVFEGKDNMKGLPPALLGIPIIFTGRVPVLGTPGDLMLCDFSYYLLKEGFGPSVEASPHLYFKENKTIIKAFHNVDGEPWLTAPLTLEDSVTQVSPFVCLL